jgi:HK97 family phage portal protein
VPAHEFSTSGTIDNRDLIPVLEQLAETRTIREVVYDPRYLDTIATMLAEAGFDVADAWSNQGNQAKTWQAWRDGVDNQTVAHAGDRILARTSAARRRARRTLAGRCRSSRSAARSTRRSRWRWRTTAAALLGVLSLITGAVSQCTTLVQRDLPEGGAKRAPDSWQWDLLHTKTASGMPGSTLRSDLAGQLVSQGSFVAKKIKSRGKVIDLEPLDPRAVVPIRRAGEIQFDVSAYGCPAQMTKRDLVYGRLVAAGTGERYGIRGVSPITALRRSIVSALERANFEQRVMRNDATPRFVLKSSAKLNQEQADDWIEKWSDRHQGAENAGKPTIIGSGDDVVVLPLNLKDLQFVEQTQLTRETIAAAYHVPLVYLGGDARGRPPTYEDRVTLATFCLGPILQCIEDYLSADDDLFPMTRESRGLYVKLLPDALLRMSPLDRYASYSSARQAGLMTSNEIRAQEDLPPHEDGDILQATPVGGAVPHSAETPPTPAADPTPPTGD